MGPRFSRFVLALAALVAAAAPAAASERYDPRLRFRTISTPHFDIHFHQGEESDARRLASIAEQVRREMEPALGLPNGRVQVILVDQHDSPNGWATPFPYNVIEVTAAAPRGGSLIGNTRDWLRLVFVHEYTHVLHLDRSRGLFAAGRRIFGRHPFALPNIFTPPWQIEGIATHYESAVTGEGRVPSGDFRLILDRAAGRERFASLDRASSDRVDWPSGQTPYLYGAYFHAFLAETYGDASLARLADATAKRPPYLGSRAYRQVFGKSLGALWTDFESATRASLKTHPSSATRLTRHGFVVSSPAYASGGRLFYAAAGPHGFPSLRELRGDGTSHEVTTRVGGGRIGVSGDVVVFDQLEFVRSVGLQSDLYEADTTSGAVRRSTRALRASDPDVTADGATLAFVIQAADRRVLATMPRAPGASPRHLVSAPGTHFASPRWSPDGRMLAAERRLQGGASEIVLVDPATAEVRVISGGDARSIDPSWTPDGRAVLFASAREGDVFAIHLFDLATGERRRLLDGPPARSPVLSPDGTTLVFVGDTAEGYDLFSLPWGQAAWAPVAAAPASAASPPPAPEPDGPAGAVSGYRPWPLLLPRFWTPIVEPDGDELTVGAATAGADALGRHAYAAGAAWAGRARPDWYAVYSYDRWRPTLVVSASDDTDPWRAGTVRTREIDAGLSLRFRTTRRTQALFAAAHAADDRFECGTCEPDARVTVRRHAARGGWTFNSSRLYGYSISREHGASLAAAVEWAPRAFGSTGDSRAVVADARAFLPAPLRHGVIALRAAAAASWGDDEAARVFGAGGPGRDAGGISFDRDAIGTIRGFDVDDAAGRRAVVVNADFRIPLAWVERGAGTWPVFARSFHGALFADGGAAWTDRLTRDGVRVSAGAELSADLVVGYVLPLTVTAGAAWRYDAALSAGSGALFARVGRAF